jgi:protein-disulfide isomerase
MIPLTRAAGALRRVDCRQTDATMPPKPRKPPSRTSGTRNRNLLIAAGAAAVVVLVLVGASLLLRDNGSGSSTDAVGGQTGIEEASALIDGIPQDRAVLGSSKAKVTMIQFEDLQCPICRRYQAEGFPTVVDEYVRPGKVKLRFVGMAFIGPDSEKALLYTLAAGEQGKLWQFQDALYANQGEENSGWVTDELLQKIANGLGLDWQKLKKDAAGAVTLQQANSMVDEANQRQIQGTPTFYIQVGDGEPYQVTPSSFAPDQFRKILDDALSG